MYLKTLGTVIALITITVLLFILWPLGPNQRTPSRSLLVGTNLWLGYEPLYLARSLELFDEETISLVEYTSASQVINAFRNGTIDVAALTLDEVLLLRERGHEVQVVLVMDVSHGGDAILAKPGIATLEDLRGKKVGVEHTALGAFMLTRALQTVAMTVADVEVVPLELSEHEQAFVDGVVDAVVTFEPSCTRLLAGGAIELFNSSELPGEIVDVLVVNRSVLESEPDLVVDLLRNWFESVNYLETKPMEAAKLMASRLDLPSDNVLLSFAKLRLPGLTENIALLDSENALLNSVAERMVEVMMNEQLLRSRPELTGLFSAEPLKQLTE